MQLSGNMTEEKSGTEGFPQTCNFGYLLGAIIFTRLHRRIKYIPVLTKGQSRKILVLL